MFFGNDFLLHELYETRKLLADAVDANGLTVNGYKITKDSIGDYHVNGEWIGEDLDEAIRYAKNWLP